LLVAIVTGLLFGLVPALAASRTDLRQGLHEGGRASTSGRRPVRLRNVLVAGEIGVACLLLISAGLILRSFVNLLRSDPGFQPQHVLTAGLALPSQEYKNGQAVSQFYDRLLHDLEAYPGIAAAGAGSDVPWTGYDDNIGPINVEGRKIDNDS